MRLLSTEELERSAVVANCRMNRERTLTGSNGYAREVGFHPLDFLRTLGRPATWLDLCCGTGRALIEASAIDQRDGGTVAIVGVDLVGGFADPAGQSSPALRLIEASLATWRPDDRFDLITCVHGLHYIGDKLGLIARAASWLTRDGRFVANLDLANLRLAERPSTARSTATLLRQAGLSYDHRHRRVTCQGSRPVAFPCEYLGADDQAGPNATGQPAVNSHYQPHPTA